MPYANPNRSWQSACRHFFRHIGDPRELRRNPIAARFFNSVKGTTRNAEMQAMESIREAILAALGAYEKGAIAEGNPESARRGRAIVVSHILGKRSSNVVAAQLALSRRQFYRERQLLYAYIARAIDPLQTPIASTTIVALRSDVVAIERARHLIEACETSRALEVLEDVIHRSSDALRRIEACCLQADAFTAQVRYDEAERRITIACEVFSASTPELTEQALQLARTRIDFSSAIFASHAGRSGRAKQLTAAVLTSLQRVISSDDETRELYVDALIFAAERATIYGNFKSFREHLSDAQAVWATIANQSPRQKAALLALAGLLYNDPGASTDLNDCIAIETAARDIARKVGSIRTVVSAATDLSVMYAFGVGDYDMALRQGLSTLEIALQTGNPTLIADVCILLADIRLTHHQFAEGLKMVAVARRSGRIDPFHDVLVECNAAAAYIGLGDYRRACAAAHRGYELGVALKNGRLQQAALRLSAVAHYRNYEIKIAQERIEAALELAGKSGARLPVALAYLTSSIINGNREHARIADALVPDVASRFLIA